MKPHILLGGLLALFVVTCNEPLTRYSFEEPFPKKNIRLNRFLGDTLILKSGTDTLTLWIHSTRQSNSLIDAETKDTLFNGIVSRYRGLYYFSHKNNYNSYDIYAVRIKDKLIYGLNTSFFQKAIIGEFINEGRYTDLISQRGERNILLHSSKKQLRNLFNAVLEALPADTILTWNKNPEPVFITDTTEALAGPDPEDLQTITAVFPNPVRDALNVNSFISQSYILYDQNMASRLNGNLSPGKTTIAVSSLPPGTYYLQVSGGKETFRILKQ